MAYFELSQLVGASEQCTARCPEHLQAAGHFDSHASPGASGLAGFFLCIPKITYFMSLLFDFEDTNSYVLFCASFPANIVF